MKPSFGPRGGQAIILLVVAMGIFMFGALGLAIDGGQIYAQFQMAQTAADAAAEAGILSIEQGTNATSTYTFGTGATPIASYVCTTTDGRTPCVYARDNGFGATASDTVTLSYPATISGVTLSSVTVPAFTVTVKRILNNGMIRFVGGPAHTTISAKAIAGITGTASTYCIYALNKSASGAFSATNGASVDASGCGIAINSNSSSALTVTGSTVTASVIDVVGKTDISNGGSATPAPNTGAAAATDPFASLPVPPLGNCTAHPTTTNPATNAVLTPGTYCGGIYVGNGATNVTFSSGNYIIDGGGLSFNGSGKTVLGNGVMFYLTGTNSTYDSVAIQNGVSVTFSAPTSGTYQGVLFFQDRSITSSQDAAVTGGASMAITGTFYFPTTNITFSNGTSAASYIALIAQQVWFTSGAKVKNDPTGTYTGLSSKSVVLAQ